MSQFLPILCVVRQSKIDPRRVGREINIVFIYFQYKRSIRALFNLAIAFWKKGQMGQLSLMSCSCHYIVFTERTTECRVNYFFSWYKETLEICVFPAPFSSQCCLPCCISLWTWMSCLWSFRQMRLWCMTQCMSCPWPSNSFHRWQSVPCSVIDTNPGDLGPASWA